MYKAYNEVVYSLIIVQVDGAVADFISFYALPSTVMHHPVHKKLNAAYAFYMSNTSVSREKLVNDALIMAKQVGRNMAHITTSLATISKP